VESYGQIKWERHKMNLSGETGPGKCNKIFFINDRFFATGADNIIASSIDGISWTTVTAGSPGTRKESIAYGPSGYILAETAAEGDSTFVWSSESGVDWIKRHSIYGYPLKAVYGNGQYVISGYNNKNAWVSVSVDCVEWTEVIPDSSLFCFTDIIYTKQKFVAVGAAFQPSYSGITMTSSDGLNWTNLTPKADRLPYELWAVAFGNERFVSLGQNGGSLISTDGVVWAKGDTSLTEDFHSVTFGKGYFVGIGDGFIFMSTDGISWTVADSVKVGDLYCQIAFGNERFVIADRSDTVLISLPFNEPVRCADNTKSLHPEMHFQVTSDMLRLIIPAGTTGSSTLICHNAAGRKMFDAKLTSSNIVFTYSTKHLPAGWYALSLVGRYGSVSNSFVIQR